MSPENTMTKTPAAPKPRAPSKFAIELLEHWRDCRRARPRTALEPTSVIINAPLPPEYADHQKALESITGLDMLRLIATSEQVFSGRLGQIF